MKRLPVHRLIPALALLLAAAAAAAREPNLGEVQRIIVEQTNRFRAGQGLAEVRPSPLLARAAQAFADYMARTDRYGHEADGRMPPERARAQGYDDCLVAENIAYEFSSEDFATQDLSQRFERGWEQSPPHRANMLDPDATETGVAVARSAATHRYYAVQMFGRTMAQARRFDISNRSASAVAYEMEGKRYALPPRMTRTHRSCRTTQLTLDLPGRSAARSFTPSDGRHYVIATQPDGRVDLTTR